jgi:SAM-dependent methyltransferase
MQYNYDLQGHQYSNIRRTDPRIAAHIHAALGPARSVLNIGAGSGSYEPEDRYVVAVEPSAVMRAQRIRNGKAPAVIATAEKLPFDDDAFEAGMALVTVHHWPDLKVGLRELRRVVSGPICILTGDPDALDKFWNVEYFPEVVAIEKRRYPPVQSIIDALGGKASAQILPIPLDCVDGFQEAFYGRPETFLQPEVRKAQSAWGFLPEGAEEIIVKRLEDDLKSGAWDRKYGHFRQQPNFMGAMCLIMGQPKRRARS